MIYITRDVYIIYILLFWFTMLRKPYGQHGMGVKFTDFPGESLIIKCGSKTYLRVGKEGI